MKSSDGVVSGEALAEFAIDDFIHLLAKSKRVIVVAGAGISVSCGIPDFRSKEHGLYNSLNCKEYDIPSAELLFDLSMFEIDPAPFYKFSRMLLPQPGMRPSLCHRFLQALDKHKKLMRLYTQNVDGLEITAGVDRKKLIQCHGSLDTFRCIECNRPRKFDDELKALMEKGEVCWCSRCSDGVLKPGITFFGECVPSTFTRAMDSDTEKRCDLVLVIGTSLKVGGSVYELLKRLNDSQTKHVLINREVVAIPSKSKASSEHDNVEMNDGKLKSKPKKKGDEAKVKKSKGKESDRNDDQPNEDAENGRQHRFDLSILGSCDDIAEYICSRLDWDCSSEKVCDADKSYAAEPLSARNTSIDDNTCIEKGGCNGNEDEQATECNDVVKKEDSHETSRSGSAAPDCRDASQGCQGYNPNADQHLDQLPNQNAGVSMVKRKRWLCDKVSDGVVSITADGYHTVPLDPVGQKDQVSKSRKKNISAKNADNIASMKTKIKADPDMKVAGAKCARKSKAKGKGTRIERGAMKGKGTKRRVSGGHNDAEKPSKKRRPNEPSDGDVACNGKEKYVSKANKPTKAGKNTTSVPGAKPKVKTASSANMKSKSSQVMKSSGKTKTQNGETEMTKSMKKRRASQDGGKDEGTKAGGKAPSQKPRPVQRKVPKKEKEPSQEPSPESLPTTWSGRKRFSVVRYC